MRRLAVLPGCVMYILLSVCASYGAAPPLILVTEPTQAMTGISLAGLTQRSSGAGAASAIGRNVTVRVRDEAGVARAGAKVYHNGRYVGRTGDEGSIVVEDVAIGDQLAALYQVHEQPSPKGHHDLDGSSDWAWRVYQTSVRIDDDGIPQPFEVDGVSVIQELTVRRDQPLVGFHVVACLEWDADPFYLADLRQGLEKASALLYDVGDGQFFWEVIEISDDRVHWADCDMRFLASNQVWPKAYVWGITEGEGMHITMGRHFNGVSPDRGRWAWEDGSRTIVHEFGHYGLGLHDEYLDARGNLFPSYTLELDLTSEEKYASIMRDPLNATELGSRMDPHYPRGYTASDGVSTLQHAETKGESPWETVLRRFRDPVNPARWTLGSPVERGTILRGPHAIPVSDWMKVYVNDHDAGACPPFETKVAYAETRAAASDAEVWVERLSSLPNLRQGKTDRWGRITIYGARPGDTVMLRKGRFSAAVTVSCSEARGGERS
jgi:hypothetical protein